MNLTGVIPPIVTPLVKQEPAPEKMVENIRKWNQKGLSGYLILGRTEKASL